MRAIDSDSLLRTLNQAVEDLFYRHHQMWLRARIDPVFGLVDKAHRDRKPEHIPLAFAATLSVVFLVIIAVVGLPLLCISNGVPIGSWPAVYGYAAIVLIPVFIAFCAMAALFGQLAHSRLSMLVAAVIFGAALPVAVLGSLSVPASVLHGDVFRGIGTSAGVRNVGFLFALLGSLGAALYWSLCRKPGKVE